MVFIDDVLIYSETPEEHEKHLQRALERLQKEQLYAKLKR
jgi:putative transposase